MEGKNEQIMQEQSMGKGVSVKDSETKESNQIQIPNETDDKLTDTTQTKDSECFTEGKDVSLQSKFEAFRKQRVTKNKQAIALKKQSALKRTDKNFKHKLRERFIETAKKYYGTPYHRKYHQEGSPHFNAKLYLDCCALVRRIIWDLREDFGFSLLPFNQNYQYETLPVEVPYDQLKPGDLIFYEGTYFPHFKARKQHHSLVHVEIFIGGETGEQSIGARWGKGVVELHQSYKFVSMNYHSVKHYYRSLDTWLDGVCK